MFTGGRGAVVAGEAAADDIGVIYTHKRDPVAVAVTVFAQVVGQDVLAVFVGGGGAVMAAKAVAGNSGMIYLGGR